LGVVICLRHHQDHTWFMPISSFPAVGVVLRIITEF